MAFCYVMITSRWKSSSWLGFFFFLSKSTFRISFFVINDKYFCASTKWYLSKTEKLSYGHHVVGPSMGSTVMKRDKKIASHSELVVGI